jgi:HEAT repeat protein
MDEEVARIKQQGIAMMRPQVKSAKDVEQIKQPPLALTLWLLPACGQGLEAAARTRARLSGTLALIAVRRYELVTGKLPRDLKTATDAAKLAKVPPDPFSAQPIRYTVIGGRPVIYSVGVDQIDDRGLVDWDFGRRPGDIVFRIGTLTTLSSASGPTTIGASGAVGKALEDLASTDSARRHAAAQNLVKIPPDEHRQDVARSLIACLGDPNELTCKAAVQALATWGDADCAPSLVALVRSHKSTFVRREAIAILGKFPSAEAAEAVAARLSEFSDRAHAAKALEAMGAVAEKPVAKQLTASDPQTADQACKILQTIAQELELANETIDSVIQFARHPAAPLDGAAPIAVLAKVKSEKSAAALADCVVSIHSRQAAADALRGLGSIAEKSVANLLKHQDPQVRVEACKILASIGTRKPKKRSTVTGPATRSLRSKRGRSGDYRDQHAIKGKVTAGTLFVTQRRGRDRHLPTVWAMKCRSCQCRVPRSKPELSLECVPLGELGLWPSG